MPSTLVRAALAALAALVSTAPAQTPTFTRAYPLAPSEGVFAYSRISPDGNYLGYASQTYDTSKPTSYVSPENLYGPRGRMISQAVTIVDLKTQKVLFT